MLYLDCENNTSNALWDPKEEKNIHQPGLQDENSKVIQSFNAVPMIVLIMSTTTKYFLLFLSTEKM